MISVVEICFVASFFINSLMIKPAEARCSQTAEFTIFDPNNQNAETCQRCPICPPGKGVSVQCGSRIKNGTYIGCQNCENGTYSDDYDKSDCKSCNRCGQKITERPCTAKQNSICSTKVCNDGYYMDPMVDECFPTHEIPTKTSAASTVSPINKSITLKSLLSKSVPPTPTGSTKSSETVEPLLSKNVTLKPTGSTKSSETVEPLLSKTVTLKPTGSTKSSEIVEPVSRKETYSTSSTKADESTKPGSQPLNSTTSVSPDQRHNLRGIIGGGILCGAILIICFIAFIKDFSQYRTLFCIRRGRKGLNRGKNTSVKKDYPFIAPCCKMSGRSDVSNLWGEI